MSRISVSILLLFVLVLITAGQGWFGQSPRQSVKPDEDYLRPNYQASQMQTRLYDSEGQLTHRIAADKMEHYDALGFTLFQRPDYWLYDSQSSEPWKIDASEATLHRDQRLQLDGKVKVVNTSPDNFISRIETEFLQIDLNEKRMHSDQSVLISGDNFRIQSNGMSGDLRQQQFELKDHVQTQYDARP